MTKIALEWSLMIGYTAIIVTKPWKVLEQNDEDYQEMPKTDVDEVIYKEVEYMEETPPNKK